MTDPVVPFLIAGGDPNWIPRVPVMMHRHTGGRVCKSPACVNQVDMSRNRNAVYCSRNCFTSSWGAT